MCNRFGVRKGQRPARRGGSKAPAPWGAGRAQPGLQAGRNAASKSIRIKNAKQGAAS